MCCRFNTREYCFVLHLEAPKAEQRIYFIVEIDCLHILVDRHFSGSHGKWNGMNEDHASHDDKWRPGRNLFQTCLLKDRLGNVIFSIDNDVYFHVLG